MAAKYECDGCGASISSTDRRCFGDWLLSKELCSSCATVVDTAMTKALRACADPKQRHPLPRWLQIVFAWSCIVLIVRGLIATVVDVW